MVSMKCSINCTETANYSLQCAQNVPPARLLINVYNTVWEMRHVFIPCFHIPHLEYHFLIICIPLLVEEVLDLFQRFLTKLAWNILNSTKTKRLFGVFLDVCLLGVVLQFPRQAQDDDPEGWHQIHPAQGPLPQIEETLRDTWRRSARVVKQWRPCRFQAKIEGTWMKLFVWVLRGKKEAKASRLIVS